MSTKGPVRVAAVMCGPLLVGVLAATNAAAGTTTSTTSSTASVAPATVSPNTLLNGLLCNPLTTTPTDAFPGTVVKADNFESGVLSGYVIHQSGTGTVAVSDDQARTGYCAVHIHATTDSTSLADMAVGLPSGTQVYADGWFNITTAGVTGNDVPYFRFFAGSTRAIDVYRYNSNGQLWLRVRSPAGTFTYTRLTTWAIPLNNWHHVQMHVIPNGSSTTVEVWFDEKELYSSKLVNTFATSISSVLLGAEHYQQMEDNYVDDLIVKEVQ